MIKPVWGRCVVRPIKIEETDPALKSAMSVGIVLPENKEKERMQHAQVEGELVAAGGNCFDDWHEPIPKPGDKVIYDKFAGFVKKIDDQEYRIISDTDILAIL